MLARSMGRGRWTTVVLAILIVATLVEPAHAQEEAKSSVRRTLRENLFLDAVLGLRQRQAVYAEDALEGPGSKSELRLYLSGSANLGAEGPLAAYVGLGLIGRTPQAQEDLGDPFGSPYDDFDFAQNARILSAYGEYSMRHPELGKRFVVRAGRLADFDGRAGLLLYDGAKLRFKLTRGFAVHAYGGRRSVLDGDFADGREDVGAQLVAGGALALRVGDFSIEAGHRFEEIHRPFLGIDWEISDNAAVGLSSQLLVGGQNYGAPDLDADTSEPGPAVLVRVDGDVQAGPNVTISWTSEVQIGTDPRHFGRGGQGPTPEDIAAAINTPITERRLDRILLGPLGSHVWSDVDFYQFITSFLGFHSGTYLRIPFDDPSSLRPSVVEVFGGPELLLSRGTRIGVEARFATEDPGDATARIFGRTGDGERTWGSLRLFGQVPIPLSETMLIAFRPELEASTWSSEGPLSDAENQKGAAASLITTFNHTAGFRAAVRYGFELLPDFIADGTDTVHSVELWLGGTY